MNKKWGSLRYLLKEWLAVSKAGFALAIIRIPVELLLPTLMAMIPKLIIDAINAKVTDNNMLILIGALTLFLVALSVVQPILYGKLSKNRFEYVLHFNKIGLNTILHVNYQELESFEGRSGYERAKAFCGIIENRMGISAGSFIWLVSDIAIAFSGIFSYIVLFTVLQPYLVIILIASSITEFLILKRMRAREVSARGEQNTVVTKLEYFYRVASEPKSGKDIRLYGLSDWFCMVLAKLMASQVAIHNKLFRKKIKLTIGQAFAVMLRDVASYGFLIYYAVIDKMSLSNFILYFGLLVGFSGWITGLAVRINSMEKTLIECDKFREFVGKPCGDNCAPLPFEGNIASLEFRDVCFRYDKAEEDALKDINFTINLNERIAIVGENGAGKTTLIKLMCGLYKPTSGQILINGIPLGVDLGNEYYKLFATVFQDFYFLPLSILENVSMQTAEKSDKNRAIECLKQAGLWDKISTLPDGLDSKMVRQVWENAVDFSGGEQQRLLLARALYKDSPILILDEPTSALDPIAEQNIYNSYKDFSNDKISVFISHRLASTQFCSNVFYMSQGEIAERGSHEELLRQKGKYWSMFEAQSYYYNHATKVAKEVSNEEK